MMGIEENFAALLESIEDCLAKRRILPCLALLYSGIDVVSSLEQDASTRSSFIRWASTYMLTNTALDCRGIDLYAARCGVLHSFTADSDLSNQGKARRIMYSWGNAKAAELAAAAKALGHDDCVLRIEELIKAFRAAVTDYFQEVARDPVREKRVEAKAGLWFTQMKQERVKEFLDAHRAFHGT